MVNQAYDPVQIATLHTSERIYDRELIRVDLVHLIDDPEQLIVGIAHNIDRVDAELVALFLDLTRKLHALGDIVIMGGNADHLDALAGIRAKLVDVIIAAHCHTRKHGIAAILREQLVQLLNGIADGHIRIISLHVSQESDLDDINIRLD